MTTIKTTHKTILADQLTPVNLYLQMRDQFPNALLLESTDYHHLDNCFSFICLEPLAEIQVLRGRLTSRIGDKIDREIEVGDDLLTELRDFFKTFRFGEPDPKTTHNGFFGYLNYDVIKYFEDIELKTPDDQIPEVRYTLYRYVLQFHHLNDSLTLIENRFDDMTSGLEKLISTINTRIVSDFPFITKGDEKSNMKDGDYRSIVTRAKKHIQRGDIFQIVLSRQFSQSFLGDEFNVYRQLRNINPSPYLFYFDYTDYKLMGSSPQIQIKVEGRKATVNPIAGTFKRTGNDHQDQALAIKLLADVKENAEHIMLVDLARNDLSRSCNGVHVEEFKEIQFYSHVIHIVSKVSGKLMEGFDGLDVLASTFPAGTLSGAPKVKAMELIDEFESSVRGFYGGCIGMITAGGDINHAIMIRSALSHRQKLIYQAGAGIVNTSIEENELQEVNHKIEALRKSIQFANSTI